MIRYIVILVFIGVAVFFILMMLHYDEGNNDVATQSLGDDVSGPDLPEDTSFTEIMDNDQFQTGFIRPHDLQTRLEDTLNYFMRVSPSESPDRFIAFGPGCSHGFNNAWQVAFIKAKRNLSYFINHYFTSVSRLTDETNAVTNSFSYSISSFTDSVLNPDTLCVIYDGDKCGVILEISLPFQVYHGYMDTFGRFYEYEYNEEWMRAKRDSLLSEYNAQDWFVMDEE